MSDGESENVWISAFHAFYQPTPTRPAVNDAIENLVAKTNCEVAMFSSFAGKAYLMKAMHSAFREFNCLEIGSQQSEELSPLGLANRSKDSRFVTNGVSGILAQFKAAGFLHGTDNWCPKDAVADVYTRKRGMYPNFGGILR